MPDRTSVPLTPQPASTPIPIERVSDTVQRPPLLRPPTLWCVLPSCVFFAFAAVYQGNALPPLPETALSAMARGEQMLPLSQTMIVSSQKTSGSVLLRGTIQAAGQVIGQAPIGGQVSRVWVRPGQHVEVSDRILQISSGSSTRAAPAAERGQNAAEATQIAAVKRQQQLEGKMRDAQAEFREAELRVEAANRKVSQTRALVARLQRGEAVPLPETGAAPDKARSTASNPTRETDASRRVGRTSNVPVTAAAEIKAAAENKHAMQEALNAQRAAEESQSKARNAFYAASAAENAARLKKARVEGAQADARKAQEKFDAGLADAAALEAARSALTEVESDATEAAGKATAARAEAGRLQSQATESKSQSEKAGQSAAQALQKTQLLANAPAAAPQSNNAEAEATSTPTATSDNSETARAGTARRMLSPEAAVDLVRAAIRESDAAAKAAARLKEQAETYSRQVNATKNRLESSAQGLAQAQQKVLDSTIQANLSSVRAPASGVVTSVANVAQEVSSGEGIVSISRSNRMEVVFRDTTGIWRHLHKGMMLPAAVLLNKPGSASQRSSQANPQATLAQYTVFQGSPAVAITIRLRDIEPTASAGQSTLAGAKRAQPVEVRGVLAPEHTGQTVDARLRAGQSVVCSVAKPGTRETIMVPADAIVAGDNGRPMIAVLTALSPSTEMASSISPTAKLDQATGVKVDDGTYSIEWRPITIGKGDGIQQEVRSGLASGERIALQAASLRDVESLQRNGSILQLTQG